MSQCNNVELYQFILCVNVFAVTCEMKHLIIFGDCFASTVDNGSTPPTHLYYEIAFNCLKMLIQDKEE